MREKVAFKVQTTVPEAYLVRPSVGFLGIGEVSEVVITLKTGKLHPTQKHKFSVLAVPTDLEVLEPSLWTPKPTLQTAVLRVVFQQPDQREARSSIPPLSVFPQADKPSPVLAKELLNANLQYTELVKFYVSPRQQGLEAEKLSLEQELRLVKDAGAKGRPETAPQQSISVKTVLLMMAIGVLLGLFVLR